MTWTERDRVRLLGKIEKLPSGCWQWTAALFQATGYGVFTRRCDDGKWRAGSAHRAAYEMLKGPIPVGLHIDHLCRVRECVNPDHLEAVTKAENDRRGESPMARQARQTHCIHGHPLSEDNLRLRPSGKRECKTCARASDQRRGSGWGRALPIDRDTYLAANKTCRRGHSMTGENVYWTKEDRPMCRTCRADYARRRRTG